MRDDIKKIYRFNICVDERENRGNVIKVCNICNEIKINIIYGVYEEWVGEIFFG